MQETMKLLAQRYHIPAERILSSWEPIWLETCRGLITMEEFWHKLFEKLGVPGDVEDAVATYRYTITTMPGMMDLLAKLHGKYILVLANNDGKGFEDVRNEQIDHFKYFDYRCSSWTTGHLKPNANFYQNILDITKLQPWECVFIDDWQENLDEAKRFGIQTILFKDAEQLEHELKKLGVDT
jgi:HAD superfamily hydrolase (TIGR01509 family)